MCFSSFRDARFNVLKFEIQKIRKKQRNGRMKTIPIIYIHFPSQSLLPSSLTSDWWQETMVSYATKLDRPTTLPYFSFTLFCFPWRRLIFLLWKTIGDSKMIKGLFCNITKDHNAISPVIWLISPYTNTVVWQTAVASDVPCEQGFMPHFFIGAWRSPPY